MLEVHYFTMKLLMFFVLTAYVSTTSSYKPIVLWHGMGDSCCNPLSMGSLMDLISERLPGVYIHSLQIGDGFISDTANGFFMNANKQVEMACELIANDSRLAEGYNALGFSQGGQFLRAVAQRCPQPKMNHLISFGGQHQGVYGLPRCLYPQHSFCDYLRSLLNYGAYWSWVQDEIVQAEYWHDPLDEEKYVQGSVFLADINQERQINQSYAENLYGITGSFVMVMFEQDTMVQPKESEWFGFYTPGQSVEITPLNQSEIYKQDKLGLKQMDAEGRLVFLSTPGDHLRFSDKWLNDSIIFKYLNN